VQIGIPKESRAREHRVALTPSGVRTLVQYGHRVWFETGAGAAAGFPDSDYQSAGATVAFDRLEPFLRADLVACVFAPDPKEFTLFQPGQTVFAFWSLPAARPADAKVLLERGITAVGLEAIELDNGEAPVLTSMSEIAGGLTAIIGAGLLLSEFGGNGILMGGAPGVPPANFVVLGAGVLGRASAQAAKGMGAQVTLLDRSVDHLRQAMRELGPGSTTMLCTQPNIEKALSFADIVVGAVALRGERAPLLVRREKMAGMKPRSVVMDLSIDMGGCFETSRPTYFPDPTYLSEGVLHFCVPNLPSVAARSANLALTNALLPYLVQVARDGLENAVEALPELKRGVYLHQGHCVRDTLAEVLGFPLDPWPSKAATGG
jgi:alanine dehydrogenase